MNSSRPDQHDGLSPLEKQGWMKEGNEWKIDWEAEEVQHEIQTTLTFLSKGCMCKTGCKTRRCSCRKGDRLCGAGCECRGCTNSIATQAEELEVENEEEDEEDDEPEEIENEEEDEQEIGNEEEDEDQEFDEEEEHIQLEIVTDSFDDEVYMYSHMI